MINPSVIKYFIFIKFIFISLLFFSCNNSNSQKFTSKYTETKFNAVEKELILQGDFPKDFLNSFNYWFDNFVKVDGLEGKVKFILFDYEEKNFNEANAKRINISVKFNIEINNKSSEQTNFIKGEVSSYGIISGSFSLQDFDQIVNSTRKDIVLRISKELN